MRILTVVAAAALAAFASPACDPAGGSPDRAVPGASSPHAAAGPPASVEEVRRLVQQFGRGGGDKDVAGEALHNLGKRAATGLLEVVKDPSTPAYELASIVFIASMFVEDPEIFPALRARVPTVRDPAERAELGALVEGFADR